MTSTPTAPLVGPHRPVRYRRWMLGGLSALAAAGAMATAGCSASGTTPAAPPTPTAPAHHHQPGIAGQISAMNGATWTVTTAKGVAYTVNLTPRTAFGSRATPATQSQFTTGERVRIAGQPSGNTVTATRVVAAKASTRAPTPPANPTSPTPAPAQPSQG